MVSNANASANANGKEVQVSNANVGDTTFCCLGGLSADEITALCVDLPGLGERFSFRIELSRWCPQYSRFPTSPCLQSLYLHCSFGVLGV